jgi:hypothetical protein
VDFLVLLFFCGLSAAVVGKIKGSSFFIWFLVGFCLPIIGTVIALLWRWEKKEPIGRCGACGRTVALTDQVCMSCGQELWFPRDDDPWAPSDPPPGGSEPAGSAPVPR